MAQAPRPISPHLQIYRWQVSNTLSILHRATGVVLSAGAVALVGWLLAVAAGPNAYVELAGIFATFFGQAVLVAWSFCFFYHLCNGIRHLAWDAGLGFDREFARRSGIFVVGCAGVLTAAFWMLALAGRG
jgi:succinate dehydrogenase / fumarate reductase cytochrome b subunit